VLRPQTTKVGLIRAFVESNRRASTAIERRLPHAEPLAEDYALAVARAMNASAGLVVDIGGGRRCLFAKHRRSAATIVAVDISSEELSHNEDVDRRIVADATKLPFASDSVDVVCSRSVVEHLPDVDRFLAEAHRVLRPGGLAVSFFPSKNAPYALIKRALPHSVGRRLMHLVKPYTKDFLGFPTYYQRCTLRAMKRALRRQGFETVETRVSYYQADYFKFLLPLYILNLAFELVAKKTRCTPLAASVLIVARKQPSTAAAPASIDGFVSSAAE
jgi:ubiquinone/menaquinone biosynthesis C-methylase UbiE